MNQCSKTMIKILLSSCEGSSVLVLVQSSLLKRNDFASKMKGNIVAGQKCLYYTALLWQKEASGIPLKSELLMFSYFTQCTFLPDQILCINPHIRHHEVSPFYFFLSLPLCRYWVEFCTWAIWSLQLMKNLTLVIWRERVRTLEMCAFLVIFTLSAFMIVAISKVDLYLARDKFDIFFFSFFMRLTFQSLAFIF